MPDQDLTGFSRVCPSCGRRVPRHLAVCRCGADLPIENASAARDDTGPARNGFPTIVVIALAAILATGAGYWMFLRPAGASTEAGDAPSEELEPPAAAVPLTAASAEARAWDAAANATISPRASAATPGAPEAPAASRPTPSVTPATIEEMVDRVMPAVVLIEATGGRGSGFFVAHDTVVTNVHVVGNDGYVTLRRLDGTTASGRVDRKAPNFDIAILKVSSPSATQTVIPMGSALVLKPGQEIVVIGSALGTLHNSVSRGIVSGLRTAGGATLVQTDAATNPGNSGGPMLDRNGAVIGITTMGYTGREGLNFGVAIDHARDLMEGRTTNLGSTSGLNDIQSQSRGSESERQQQQGEEQFRSTVGQMADAARNVDATWKRFREQCYQNPIPGRYDREWFAVLAPRGIPADAGSGCVSYYSAMESDIRQFRDLMRRLVTDARRANVLPGTIRDQLRTSRLDFEW